MAFSNGVDMIETGTFSTFTLVRALISNMRKCGEHTHTHIHCPKMTARFRIIDRTLAMAIVTMILLTVLHTYLVPCEYECPNPNLKCRHRLPTGSKRFTESNSTWITYWINNCAQSISIFSIVVYKFLIIFRLMWLREGRRFTTFTSQSIRCDLVVCASLVAKNKSIHSEIVSNLKSQNEWLGIPDTVAIAMCENIIVTWMSYVCGSRWVTLLAYCYSKSDCIFHRHKHTHSSRPR